MHPQEHIVIIGAGIIGATSAYQCLNAGLRVTLVEPEQPGDEQAASFGNAGWLSSHSVLPPAAPGAWKHVPGWLTDPLGPLAIRWKYFPRALPWLTRYLNAASNYTKIERTAVALRSLLAGAPALHQEMAEQAGVGHLIVRTGLLHAYLSKEHFAKDAKAWDIRKKEGILWKELNAAELAELEPDLDRRYTFGVLVPETGSCRNPGAYTAALIAHAQARGAQLIRARATGFRIENGALQAVITDSGEIPCDKAVIAIGARSKELARLAGDKISLESERGYHAVLAAPEAGPRIPTMFADRKVIVTPMERGLRVAGQVEIAQTDDTPDWRRAEILRKHLVALYPKLPADFPTERITIWMGRRPSTPDGLPCIGLASGCADIIHAYGHGHVGLVGSARTGRLVAQLATGSPPEISLVPFSPQRFQSQAP
jgi:D-amino-acid dehydrogenase